MSACEEPAEAIFRLVAQMQKLQRTALEGLAPQVEIILREDGRDVRHIEQVLDGLLDVCGYEPAVAQFRRLCRHYWEIDPEATARYVNAYREMWDCD